MAPWFLNAKGFVYPGSVGLSILHAMSYGLPVIVHDNSEHQMPEYEIMEDGNTGLCFKEDSVDSLVEKMVVMKEDSNLRNRMSKIAKDYALSKYSMEAMVNNFSEALDVAMRL
jgi:glycosyltransferase involved in cell wall biosynthesis